MKIGPAAFIALCLLTSEALSETACPSPITVGEVKVWKFTDGSIAFRRPLAVNPDGSQASYMAGDRGSTYVANGVNLLVNGTSLGCTGARFQDSTKKFLEAESLQFAAGTAKFCSFAIDVEAFSGKPLERCSDGHIFGNGKGRPKVGGVVETFGGTMGTFYEFMTSLKHTVSGKAQYLNSAVVPTIVFEKRHPELKGHVVWVRSASFNRELFAVAGDAGPAFGEASVSVHQLLRYGELLAQKPGPIPLAMRCNKDERELKAPFLSRPDAPDDVCNSGHKPQSKSDIRAYSGMSEHQSVDTIILGNAKYELQGGQLIGSEVTPEALKQMAQAKYTDAQIKQMAACLQ